MYRVRFTRKLGEHSVDQGDVVVCAQTQQLALIVVAEQLELPASETQFEVARVKPSLYQISRKTVDNRISTFDAETVSEAMASNATFPGVTESYVDRYWFEVAASAEVKATDEGEAMGLFAASIARELAGERPKRTRNLDIACNRLSEGPRLGAVEQNALYTHRRFFQGGDTRT